MFAHERIHNIRDLKGKRIGGDAVGAAAGMALAMREATAAVARDLDQPLQLRIGIHSGPLVAGVIGTRKFVYDVWGDTVNTANRMEKYDEPGRIHLSAATRALLGARFCCEPRGRLDIKGKGAIETFFLKPRALPVRQA